MRGSVKCLVVTHFIDIYFSVCFVITAVDGTAVVVMVLEDNLPKTRERETVMNDSCKRL